MDDRRVAAIDIGKTHTRLAVVDPTSCSELWSAKRSNRCVATPLGRQLDVQEIEHWLIEAFKSAPELERIEAVVPIAHGAAAVLLDSEGHVLAAPDYEDACFESLNAQYEPLRDPFEQTYSPSLPGGLNIGRQLFYIQSREPLLFSRVAHVLTYPQYWSWRLSGVMASELTSLGCHTDLWLPHAQTFSHLARAQGWDALFPPVRFAGDALGLAHGEVAKAAGLAPDCRIACGIHDSNASYLRYLLDRRDQRFAVISSGTWAVIMANGIDVARLRAGRDMLANVDVFGSAVATARFMGGREYEAIARTPTAPTTPMPSTPASPEALQTVLDRGAMALPSFAAGGPFAASKGRLLHTEGLEDPERAALATLYVSLMSDLLIEWLDVNGDLIIDGPLATNALFGALMASLRPDNRILVNGNPTAMKAICYLAGLGQSGKQTLLPPSITIRETNALLAYRAAWRQALGMGTDR